MVGCIEKDWLGLWFSSSRPMFLMGEQLAPKAGVFHARDLMCAGSTDQNHHELGA
jgi:hypothetical protein